MRMKRNVLREELKKVGKTIERMADPDILVWLGKKELPSEAEVVRAATIIADRLCGAVANPIIRNAQEQRQLKAISDWLTARGYKFRPAEKTVRFDSMPPGTFAFRVNIPVKQESTGHSLNIPVDVAIKPRRLGGGPRLPLLVEAKSAGDFTNVNKRRKEEATKMSQLRRTYGQKVPYILFLCGYFDSGYLGYEAAEGIDWVWEHRIDDLERFGL